MKKIWCMFPLLLLILGLSACMRTQNFYITGTDVTDHSLAIIIENDTNVDLLYGDFYSLEKFDSKNGVWIELFRSTESLNSDVAYVVKPGGTDTWEIDWSDEYGSLEPGDYRIITEICGTVSV